MRVMLQGEVVHRGDGYLILQCQHEGYRILLPNDAGQRFSGNTIIYTHEVVREDRHDIFGFPDVDALELFWKLINISGVGPKIAQKIIYAAPTVTEIRRRLMGGDLGFLTSISGVGKKGAQKILLEMKGVLVEEESRSELDEDALAALLSLGYPQAIAEKALAQVEAETSEGRVREVLKQLG